MIIGDIAALGLLLLQHGISLILEEAGLIHEAAGNQRNCKILYPEVEYIHSQSDPRKIRTFQNFQCRDAC